jgi:hypothetical protein
LQLGEKLSDSPEEDSTLSSTLKSTKELLKSLKATTQEQLRKNVPKVANYLDNSIDEASKGFSDVINSLDKRTSVEQRELLKAYSSFLQKQVQLVDKRLSSLEKEKPPGSAQVAPPPEASSPS